MPNSPLGPLHRETLAEQAERTLKRFILSKALKPGDQLPSERELCDILGVSRNVVREALSTLVSEGYIRKDAGRGAFVQAHNLGRLQDDLAEQVRDADEGRNLLELRAALEIGAMSFVIHRITKDQLARLDRVAEEMKALFQAGQSIGALDREFHDVLFEATHNEAFTSLRQAIVHSLHMKLLDPHEPLHRSEARDARSVSTVEQIVRALKRRDLEGAESAMRTHVTVSSPPGQARLFVFVDDRDVESFRNVTRRVNAAHKHPHNPVMKPEYAWEGQRIFPSSTVLHDAHPKVYRMWYHGYRYLSPKEEQYSLCYATSIDGTHWQKPPLMKVPGHNGDLQGNLLIPWGDPLRPDTASATVFCVPEAQDPDHRYSMVHFCHGMHPLGLGVSFSPDGLRWEPCPQNPVDCGGKEPIGDVVTALVDPGAGRVAVYYCVRLRVRPRRALARAESTDLVHWTGHRVVLESDDRDPPGTELQGMTPFRYGDLILAFLWIAGQEPPRAEVQLACSRDGLVWERVGERCPLLEGGSDGAFDSGTLSYVTAPVVIGDELWFYYAGTAGPLHAPGAAGIGLATLRMDRFVSLEAGSEEGAVTMKPVAVADQTKLLLNGVVNPGGYILVELLDLDGCPIEGYTREDCVPFNANAVFHPIEWKERSDLANTERQMVRIRFILRNARLYAFRLCRPDAAVSDLVAGVC